MLHPGRLLQGRYRIERLIGRGGMGAVYAARHLTLGSRVAVKEMAAAADSPATARVAVECFRREGELLASLQHAGVVRVTDCFEDADHLYLVMELIDGETLQSIVEREGPLPVRTAVGRLIECCDVLAYLHGQTPPVLVRDLKPGNLIVDSVGRLRLIDFGLAHATGAAGRVGATDGGGTPGYAPVEQLTGTTDARCDIYALGATAYTVLTRRLPPDALDRLAGQAPLLPPSHFNGAVPPALDEVVLKMMALHRHARYGRVEEARAALAGLLDGLADEAPAPVVAPAASLEQMTQVSRAERETDDDGEDVLAQETVLPTAPAPRGGPRHCGNCKGSGRSRRVQRRMFGGARIVPIRCPDCLGCGVAVEPRLLRDLEQSSRGAMVLAPVVFVGSGAPLMLVAGWGAVSAVPAALAAAGLAWGVGWARRRRLQGAIDAQVRAARDAPPVQTTSPAPPRKATEQPSRASGRIDRFVGRETELATLEGLLTDSRNRLVTVLGLGGGGKTRLVTEACRRLADRLPPVVSVSLGGVVGSDEVIRCICEALGVRGSAGNLHDRLARALFSREALLLVDGAEGLSGSSFLVDLLAAAPRLQVVCTSRHTLHVEGESIVEVGGLDYPDVDARTSDIRASSAVGLFVARASGPLPDFLLDDSSAPHVAAICRRLQGHPYSIEVAASQLRTLSLRDLEDRLGAVRSAGGRDLREIIDWSYQLLAPEQQRFLLQLSVFRGFWLDAAEQLLGDGERDLAPLLSALHDHSLLSSSPLHGRRRYALLESVRTFAEGCFDATIEEAERQRLRQRHARCYCARLEGAMESAHGPTDPASTGVLVADLDNYRAARDWARDNDAPLAARIGIAGAHFLARHGSGEEARAWAMQAREAAGEDDLVAARASLALADVLHDLGELDAALVAADAARPVSDAAIRARADNLAGVILQALGRTGEARTRLEQSLEVRVRRNDARAIAVVRHNLALLDQAEGRFEEALREYDEVLAVRRELSDRRGLGETLNNRGEVLKILQRFDEAETALRAARREYEQAGDRLGVGIARYNLGEMLVVQSRVDEAQVELAAALAAFEGLRLLSYAAAARDLLRQTYEEAVAASPDPGQRRSDP